MGSIGHRLLPILIILAFFLLTLKEITKEVLRINDHKLYRNKFTYSESDDIAEWM